jgi:hypothetical protein
LLSSLAAVGCSDSGKSCAALYEKLKSCASPSKLPAKSHYVSACVVALEEGDDTTRNRLRCAKKASCDDFASCVGEVEGAEFTFRLKRDLAAKRWGDALIGCSSSADEILASPSRLQACRDAFRTALPELTKTAPDEARRQCGLAQPLRAGDTEIDQLCAGPP